MKPDVKPDVKSHDAESDRAATAAPEPLLAMDCSTSCCTLALRVEGQPLSFVEDLGRSHSQRILPELNRLREQALLGQRPLAAVGVVVGPGSFTGVRIAVATAQALAFAYACPVLRLDALQVVAQTAVLQGQVAASTAGWVCCARRSRGDLYYLAAYAVDPERSALQAGAAPSGAAVVRRVGTTVLLDSPDAATRWLATVRADLDGAAGSAQPLWLGDAVPWLADSSAALAPATAATPEPGGVPIAGSGTTALIAPSAQALLVLCDSAFANGEAVSADEALPFYLDADSPWVRRRS